MENLTLHLWLRLAGMAAVVIVGALIAHRVLRPVLRRLSSFSPVLSAIVQHCERPTRYALPLLALTLAWQGVPEEMPGIESVQHLTGVLLIVALTWTAMRAVKGAAKGMLSLHPADVADNLQARRIHTQTRVLARTASTVVLIAGLAFILMTFPRARQLGASLLASAGVVGLVAGIAARSVFSNLLAGLQIALAQPLRIDDVLIIEGEWGRVEEITATYVVLKIWDERRLIIPLQWFIEHPFQNWTRRSSEILGTVLLWVDYGLPVEPIRAEAKRLCEGSPDWDGRVCVVQVTDASDRAKQLRILISAADSGKAFELRCLLRERLIDFIQREHPASLPRLRAELGGPLAGMPEAPAP
ncbi:mechanosensitive ion channel family protein [Roseateles sp. DAIF2]|uniref:mechanosensitive ion channel family protein n=1 Tax=Roseateles sp. DAIF2 TaxID=2714952 RepID=UPI0018A27132|nr:mechanosensitive ion channel family protein [Roseateles sp. DAIF2]QPF74800.1 mechanosensitive ion channel family protein [Roseateles sp. DAIF2]